MLKVSGKAVYKGIVMGPVLVFGISASVVYGIILVLFDLA